MKITGFGFAILSIVLSFSSQVFATSYKVPPENQAIIGEIQYSSLGAGDSIASVAQHYDVGFNAVEDANPHLTGKLRAGTTVKIPTRHLLPNLPRKGIIVNLSEMRMYYFPAGTDEVFTYPIGIGKVGKTIPIRNTRVTKKVENPTWVPTESIREFNLQRGIVLPQIIPPGPDNPLGPYAIYMEVPTYLIHSTPFPQSVGTRASFGCIRMYESDVKNLFPSIVKGIPVAIINEPIKVGWQDDKLYIEAHDPLEEHSEAYETSLPGMVQIISNKSKEHPVLIDWQLISYIAKDRDGIPHEIGMRINQEADVQ